MTEPDISPVDASLTPMPHNTDAVDKAHNAAILAKAIQATKEQIVKRKAILSLQAARKKVRARKKAALQRASRKRNRHA